MEQLERNKGGSMVVVYGCSKEFCNETIREGVKKKLEKGSQAGRLDWPPPLPWSGQENVKIFDFDFRLYILIIYDSKQLLTKKNVFLPLTPPDPSQDIPWYPRF